MSQVQAHQRCLLWLQNSKFSRKPRKLAHCPDFCVALSMTKRRRFGANPHNHSFILRNNNQTRKFFAWQSFALLSRSSPPAGSACALGQRISTFRVQLLLFYQTVLLFKCAFSYVALCGFVAITTRCRKQSQRWGQTQNKVEAKAKARE